MTIELQTSRTNSSYPNEHLTRNPLQHAREVPDDARELFPDPDEVLRNFGAQSLNAAKLHGVFSPRTKDSFTPRETVNPRPRLPGDEPGATYTSYPEQHQFRATFEPTDADPHNFNRPGILTVSPADELGAVYTHHPKVDRKE